MSQTKLTADIVAQYLEETASRIKYSVDDDAEFLEMRNFHIYGDIQFSIDQDGNCLLLQTIPPVTEEEVEELREMIADALIQKNPKR